MLEFGEHTHEHRLHTYITAHTHYNGTMKVPHEHTVVRLLQRPVGPIQPGRDLVAIREETPVAADLKPNQVTDQKIDPTLMHSMH